MPTKRLRARVNVGTEEAPIIRWASGKNKKELTQAIARITLEATAAKHPPEALEAIPPEPADTAPMEAVLPAPMVTPSRQIASPPAEPTAAPTLEAYARNWFDLYKLPHVRPATLAMYDNLLSAHIIPALGSTRIDAISSDDLQRFILRYADKSSSLITKLCMVLKQIFGVAFDDGLIPKNPTKKMRPPLGTKGERIPLPLDDVREMVYNCIGHRYGLMPIFMVFTGLRRGEVIGLQWQDIDGSVLHVRRSVTYQRNTVSIVGQTKTQSGIRTVPITPMLASLLNAYRADHAGPDPVPSHYVFGTDVPMPYTTFKRHWAELQRDVPQLSDVTPHRLRHTYLMLLRRAGVDPATQQHLMGHADYDTTVNDYTHIDAYDVSDAAALISRLEIGPGPDGQKKL